MAEAAATGAAKAPRRGADRALLWIEAIAGIGVVAAIIGKSYGAAPTITFIIAALATAFAGYSVVRAAAAWSDDTLDVVGRVRDLERETLEHEKLLLLQGIKELEADAAVGKVDKRDYDHLRSTAEARALAIIEKLRADDAKWMRRAEDLVRDRLGSSAVRTAVEAALEPASAPARGAAPASAPVAPAATARPTQPPADARLFDDRPVVLSLAEGALVCAACGAKSDADARYCTGCGRPRQVEAA